jgi:ubiquinone/menaquinone biosynthesis C-methylase UbiE
MRDPTGLNERLFALWYPLVSALSERGGQRETRANLVSQARGRTLEIGAGSGLNLPHYTDAVDALVVTEPSPHMLRHLRGRLESAPPAARSWELLQAGGEELPFEDASFDTVVATFVHCTIPDPARALLEITRVLRPGGIYLFLEHVRATDGTVLARAQDALEKPHRYIAAGCYPNRRTELLLAESPLAIESLEHGSMPLSSPSVRPTIIGLARRSSAVS